MALVFNKNYIMKKTKIFLITVAGSLSFSMLGYAQHTTGPGKDSASYPYVNTPNHNADAPVIHGTFDDPKIIPDTAEFKRDNRSRENLDSLRKREKKKPGNVMLKKDTL